jgi:hypothetical protein
MASIKIVCQELQLLEEDKEFRLKPPKMLLIKYRYTKGAFRRLSTTALDLFECEILFYVDKYMKQ